MLHEARTVVVCVSAATAAVEVLDVAFDRVAGHGLLVDGPVEHFVTRPVSGRWRLGRRRRPPVWTFGGPVRALDLAGMRHAAAAGAAELWQVWHRVVAKTPPARPYWSFVDRHVEDPQRWPMSRVADAFASQPRCQAMAVFNATVPVSYRLPIDHLEAFQAGADAYTRLAALAAVPADAVAADDVPGRWWTPASRRLADRVAYLSVANQYLDGLHPDTQLVAVAAR